MSCEWAPAGVQWLGITFCLLFLSLSGSMMFSLAIEVITCTSIVLYSAARLLECVSSVQHRYTLVLQSKAMQRRDFKCHQLRTNIFV
jgi:hypothetical protein